MSYQNQPSSTPLPSQREAQTTLSKPRFARVRGGVEKPDRSCSRPAYNVVSGNNAWHYSTISLW